MTEQMAGTLEDLSRVSADKPTREEWESLIQAKSSGRTVLVSESVADYYLEVLPPRWMPGGGAFAFCEGDDRYTLFVRSGDQWLMRTLEYGERSHPILVRRAQEMIASYGRHRQITTQA